MSKKINTFLFVELPSFISGVRSLVDHYSIINNNKFIVIESKEIDYKALESDWQSIGMDIENGISEYEESHANAGK